jgi:4-amino-4-deoxy-L-arabinose transferase-like glycosyltransferase
MRSSRAGLAIVLVCFCAPLFVGLGRGDLRGDEAGHSFSIDRMLETGDWLIPLGSAETDQAFLEKPPLKFWIVALPIRLGLLPHNEFGLRFWDAVFGSAAFLYVFAIGVRLAGSACGVVSVLTLFAFWPLVFDHGLRSNNMEAALVLSYCGGIYHFLRWTTAATERQRRAQPLLVALYFVLGFMTKFVAALFLPLVLALAIAVVSEYRARFRQNVADWVVAVLLAFALIAPWFLYAYRRYGSDLVAIMFTSQVYTRLTGYLDPAHVQPWSFYWVSVGRSLMYAGSRLLVTAGLAALAVQTLRRRWAEGVVVLLWCFVPAFLLSFGTSKLTHYAYPFVPPLALAGGYLAALVLALGPLAVGRIAWSRPLMVGIAAIGAALAVATVVAGDLRLTIGGSTILRNTSILRPALIAGAAACLAVRRSAATRLATALLLAVILPLPAYAENLGRLNDDRAPLREMRDCLTRVQSTPDSPSGLNVDVPEAEMVHPIYYYFRTIRPWTHRHYNRSDLAEALAAGAHSAPVLMSRSRLEELRREAPDLAILSAATPLDDLDLFIFLPNRSAACGGDVGPRSY